MNLAIQRYLESRRLRDSHPAPSRQRCLRCRRPDPVCYCSQIQKFDPKIEFAILIHPIEFRRPIATGRMSSLCLHNSHLILGDDYTHNHQVNALIQNPKNECVILYPSSHGIPSINLTHTNEYSRNTLFSCEKNLVAFVIDGTWHTAKKTMWHSQNLKKLPRICFTPQKPSQFQVRKQPSETCYSTLEAIHQTIDYLGHSRGFDVLKREHDSLLHVFKWMVEHQIAANPFPKIRRVIHNS